MSWDGALVQILYVAEFDVSARPGTPGSISPFDALLTHTARWLSRDTSPGITVQDLSVAGACELGAETSLGPVPLVRQVTWAVEGTESVRALRLDVTQPLAQEAASFVTRVTVAKAEDRATLRVALGREITSGWLSPARIDALHRPLLIANVCRDQGLAVRVLGQRVDSQYVRIRDHAGVQVLCEALELRTRLPVLLIHAFDDLGWAVARKAATGLLGLASVATINYAASRALTARYPDLQVPDGGALLVWPDPEAVHLRTDHAGLSRLGDEGMRAWWMNALAELSVVARGPDTGWSAARQAAQREATRAAEARIAAAREHGDLRKHTDVLEERLVELGVEARFWEEQALQLSEEAEELRSRAEGSDHAARERDYWKQQFYALQDARAQDSTAPADLWAQVPELQPSDAVETFGALESIADSRIVFTDAARRSWSTSAYPYPREMTDQLIALARAAVDLYTGDLQDAMPRLQEWFKTGYALNFAPSDHNLKNNRRLRYFVFDGTRMDALPHIKVRDAVSPNEVGRIYFAFDTQGRRLVVNHVGLKRGI